MCGLTGFYTKKNNFDADDILEECCKKFNIGVWIIEGKR